MKNHLKLFISLLILSGCSQKVEIGAEDPNSDSALKITVLSKDTVVADGFTDLNVSLKVEDMLGNPVSNYSPTFQLTASTGVNYSTCTVSNSQGLLTCTFRSMLEGTKVLHLPGDQNLDITFLPSREKFVQMFDVVPGSDTVTAGTSTVSASVGKTYDKPRQRQDEKIMRFDVVVKH